MDSADQQWFEASFYWSPSCSINSKTARGSPPAAPGEIDRSTDFKIYCESCVIISRETIAGPLLLAMP